MSFLDSFVENVRKYPDKVALEFLDPPLQRLTYAELEEQVNRTARYLQSRGVQRGDRVALQLSKCIEFILLHLATVRLGAISLPLNLAYPPDELKYFLEDSAAKLFFALETSKEKIQPNLSQLPELKECVFLNPSSPEEFDSLIAGSQTPSVGAPGYSIASDFNDTAVIIYTSGTTGRPKGAEITHGNLASNLQSLHEAWGWTPDDVLLHVLPIFHVHGLFVALHGALRAGATTLLMREFDAQRTLDFLSSGRCTVFMAVPTIHKRLLDLPNANQFDLSRVRLITSGSDRLPDETFKGFQQTFGYTLLERYGMTETGMNCSNPLNGERRIGSVGLPLPGVDVRIVNAETRAVLPVGEIGEVEIRGPNVFKGYWRQPEKTAESFSPDGWFKTGDLGYLEPDGYVTLCGRSKDLIISGGLNVYPPEVERVLVEHAAVSACAVIGCPDAEWGEKVTAVVTLTEGASVSGEELIRFCRERLAPYKSPKSIVFRESLPRNAMGKIQKAQLRNEVCQPGC
ncbi:MAG: AMP-binding protein [Anaerolineales bacterium]|nr:AMP-binding protein [Anaerolineales bacterium]NUQ86114.1 AMP-binding protein [Anaerolineales bacterium]